MVQLVVSCLKVEYGEVRIGLKTCCLHLQQGLDSLPFHQTNPVFRGKIALLAAQQKNLERPHEPGTTQRVHRTGLGPGLRRRETAGCLQGDTACR